MVFPHPRISGLHEEQKLELEIDGSAGEAEILGLTRDELTLLADLRLEGPIPRATLSFDRYIGQVLERLRSIRDHGPEAPFALSEADKAVDRDHDLSMGDVPDIGGPLNVKQSKAVQLIRTARTSFLWGPPGTGKTSTLAVAIAGFVEDRRSVLIVSNTNAAVDVLARKAAEVMERQGSFSPGAPLLRMGAATPMLLEFQRGVLTVDGALAARGHQERVILQDLVEADRQARQHQAALSRRGSDWRGAAKRWQERVIQLTDLIKQLRQRIGVLEDELLNHADAVATTPIVPLPGRSSDISTWW